MFEEVLRKLIEIGFELTVLFMFIGIVLPKEDPFKVIFNAFKEIKLKFKFYRVIFGVIIIYFAINILETKFDYYFTHQILKTDFTHIIYFIEGNSVGRIQLLLKNTALTIFLTHVYVFTFPIQFFSAMIIYIHKKMHNMTIATVVSLGLNYFLVLPFYIFFPVHEVWFYKSNNVAFFAPLGYPYISMDYRNMSGIDNCFPSFHTSMAVTMIILAYHSKIKPLYYLTLIFSVLTIISTIYLGIHWLTDVAAGIFVGWAGTYIGIKFGDKKAGTLQID